MKKYPKIIALDFDGCVVTDKYPEIGEPIEKNIKKIKEEIAAGTIVILWTGRVNEYLQAAINVCKEHEIHLDAVNENVPWVVEEFGNDSRKIFANEYWDDRAVLMSEKDISEFSDGYHTFNDLYMQRRVLSATLFNSYKEWAWKSRKHSDGQSCFGGGWFIVGIDTGLGQYSYHYEDRYWDMFDCKELDVAPEWDGHTDKDVYRLASLCMDKYKFEIGYKSLADPDEVELHKTCAGCVYDEENCTNPNLCNKNISGYTGWTKVKRSNGLRENLAALAHEQWSGWMEYLFEKSFKNEDGTVTMPKWAVDRWSRQMKTSYKDLSLQEQDSDRIEADKFLKVLDGENNPTDILGTNKIATAVDILRTEFQKGQSPGSYYDSWVSNIACCIMDQYSDKIKDHLKANEAAKAFIKLLIDK